MTITPGADLAAAFKALKDGDSIVLSPGAYKGGVTLRGRKNIRISGPGAVITGGEDALKVLECRGVSLEGITFVAAVEYGCMIQNSQAVTLTDCHARDCGTTGFLTAATDDVSMLQCSSVGAKLQHGAYISQRCKKARITGGTYSGNARSGIQANCDAGGATDIEISGITAEGNQHAGGAAAIQVAYAVGGKITGNTIRDHHGRSGIALWQHSRGFVIDGNRIEFAPGFGMSCIDLAAGSDATVGPANSTNGTVPLVVRH